MLDAYNATKSRNWDLVHLSDVTLLMIDGGVCLELARLSLLDTLSVCSFDEVLVATPEDLKVEGAKWLNTPVWPSNREPSAWLWYEFPKMLRTNYLLITTWDSWVIDASVWSEEFKAFDYLGAPWWYSELNVGHGLFRSRKLMQFLGDHRDEFPITHPVGHPEDSLLSRIYRPALEARGFRWPSDQVASRFMFECTRPSHRSRHFMFHDSFNFVSVLSRERFEERKELMLRTPYLGRLRVEHNERQSVKIMPRLTFTGF